MLAFNEKDRIEWNELINHKCLLENQSDEAEEDDYEDDEVKISIKKSKRLLKDKRKILKEPVAKNDLQAIIDKISDVNSSDTNTSSEDKIDGRILE